MQTECAARGRHYRLGLSAVLEPSGLRAVVPSADLHVCALFELVKLELEMIELKTIVAKGHVRYLVIDHEDRLIFNEVVNFGLDRAHRAGGWAFRNAARQQAACAAQFSGPTVEIIVHN